MLRNNQQKTVCIVMGSHWSAVMGGAQYQAKCILDQLKKTKEYHITYLARILNKEYKADGYDIVQIAENKGIRKYGYIFDIFRLNKILKEVKPDIIYQRGLKAYTGILAYFSKKNNCKFIFHVAHDYDVIPDKNITIHSIIHPLEKKVGEYGIRHADNIIVQTTQQLKWLEENYQRADGVLIKNFHPKPEEDINRSGDLIKVVWVANFKPIKRPEYFVRLAKDLEYIDNVEFIMVGRSGSKKIYQDLHEIIVNGKNIKYVGEKTIDQVNKILSESHIFVNTSIAEGFPNTFIQSWMRGVPVVSVSIYADGIFDAHQVGICGETYEGMKKAVVKLITNKRLREKMGRMAKQYAFKEHSIDNINKIIHLMEK
jgi:glycosyltransferase involved in cell wall biosynthesis